MMLTTSVNPGTAFTGAVPAPMFDAWSGIANLYRDAMESSAQQLLLSSARIIQEHTLRAFMDASRACADALAKNAMEVQQQSMGRFADANQKAMTMMGSAVMTAWMGGMRPAK
jgi:hypothetical protein